MEFYMLTLLPYLELLPLLFLQMVQLHLEEIQNLQDKYGVLLMAILVILITENFIEILVMKQITTILSHILLIMVFAFILVLNITALLEKPKTKMFIIFNGQKILLRNKLVIFLTVELLKQILLVIIHKTHQLFYVLMMLNYMDTGGMKDLIGYIFYLKKSIITNLTLN